MHKDIMGALDAERNTAEAKDKRIAELEHNMECIRDNISIEHFKQEFLDYIDDVLANKGASS